jgi:hypothetical protein
MNAIYIALSAPSASSPPKLCRNIEVMYTYVHMDVGST